MNEAAGQLLLYVQHQVYAPVYHVIVKAFVKVKALELRYREIVKTRYGSSRRTHEPSAGTILFVLRKA